MINWLERFLTFWLSGIKCKNGWSHEWEVNLNNKSGCETLLWTLLSLWDFYAVLAFFSRVYCFHVLGVQETLLFCERVENRYRLVFSFFASRKQIVSLLIVRESSRSLDDCWALHVNQFCYLTWLLFNFLSSSSHRHDDIQRSRWLFLCRSAPSQIRWYILKCMHLICDSRFESRDKDLFYTAGSSSLSLAHSTSSARRF